MPLFFVASKPPRTPVITATPKSRGDTAHAQGKYFWLYARDGSGSWKLRRGIVSLGRIGLFGFAVVTVLLLFILRR